MLLYQVIKLFVVNRLTPKLLKSLPGVDPKSLGAMHVVGSNVYSPSEGLLLGWLSYHHAQIQPTDKLVVSNFDSDLHDCRVRAPFAFLRYLSSRGVVRTWRAVLRLVLYWSSVLAYARARQCPVLRRGSRR